MKGVWAIRKSKSVREILGIALVVVIVAGTCDSLPAFVGEAEPPPATEMWNWCELDSIRDKLTGTYNLTNDPYDATADFVEATSSIPEGGERRQILGDSCADSGVRDMVEPEHTDDPDWSPVIEALTLNTSSLASLPGWYWYASYDNYAPSGMPDFDQRQDGWWKDPDARVPWTFCLPTAATNCFWWLDSKYADPTGVPGDGNDTFPLVRDYGGASSPVPGPNWDDHNFSNVNDPATPWPPEGSPPATAAFVTGPQPQSSSMPAWGELVERLAWYMDSDGIRTGDDFRGTYPHRMLRGVRQWLEEEGLDHILGVISVSEPNFYSVVEKVERGECVMLTIGWWDEEEPGEWRRTSGHSVTVAGVNSDELLIALSDSGFDQTPPDNPQDHNDAAMVSHDIWPVDLDCPRPTGTWWLRDYGTEFSASLGIDVISQAVVEDAVIIFSVPPSVTTQAASAIGTTSASVNMTYTLGGQTTVDLRFAYRKASEADWTGVPWIAVSAQGVSPSEGATHNEILTGLDSNSTYEFKAELRYDEIVIPGHTLNFTTMEKGRCFIATAAYGTPMADETQILRGFRDKYLLTDSIGQAFVDVYYTISPPIADFISDHPCLKPVVRAGLMPIVAICSMVLDIAPQFAGNEA